MSSSLEGESIAPNHYVSQSHQGMPSWRHSESVATRQFGLSTKSVSELWVEGIEECAFPPPLYEE